MIKEEVWDIKQYGVAYKMIADGLAEEILEAIKRAGGPIGSDPKVYIKHPSLSQYADPLASFWTQGFKTSFPARELVKMQWPKTWWDHFKERWFPQWALLKWPAQHHRLEITALIDNLKMHEQHGNKLVYQICDTDQLISKMRFELDLEDWTSKNGGI